VVSSLSVFCLRLGGTQQRVRSRLWPLCPPTGQRSHCCVWNCQKLTRGILWISRQSSGLCLKFPASNPIQIMWRSNAQTTGSNIAPLGNPRRWGGGGGDPQQQQQQQMQQHQYHQEQPPPGPPPQSNFDRQPPPPPMPEVPEGPRKRKSRWGDETSRVQMPGVVTAINSAVNSRDLDNYASTSSSSVSTLFSSLHLC
jgi:hypothetical protein